MPSIAERHFVNVYNSAISLPQDVWAAWEAFPRDSNIMYPHALRMKRREAAGKESNTLWIVCTTPSFLTSPSIDLVLSCTDDTLGTYPIFIFTPIPPTSLYPDYLYPRLGAIADALYAVVRVERVFSVFALETVTAAFAAIWTAKTGVPLDKQPAYYAAKGTYCTRDTFLPARRQTPLPGLSYDLRLARKDDAQNVAELCYGFAIKSEPFVLSRKEALHEAEILISEGKVWVHQIQRKGQPPEIASIVAVTRTSDTVAGITKVYTNPRWRNCGCAERLTRHVTKHFLKTKDSVVLYVAHNNPAAAGVYARVGFVGIGPEKAPVEGVYDWLELGFDQSRVELGHW